MTMRPRFAYWTKEPYALKAPTTIPQRLRDAWPNLPGDGNQRMHAQAHPSGVGTLIVFPAYDGSAVNLADFGEPRETFDGMTYYPSKDEPDTDWLIRPEESRPTGEWVKTFHGELFVSLALAAPRRLILSASGGYRAGASVSEFGRLGHEIYDDFVSAAGLQHGDTRLWRFLFLTLRAGYWLTEEIMEDLPWLTDADVMPILLTALGCNPKPSAAEPAGSPSSAQTTPASP